VRAAAEALHHVHEQGIVHCDLKPANLLLTQRGQIKLTDFGFARRVDDASASWRALAGTVPFMAPEQVDPCWGEVDRRTDVYGLGAVLLTLLTGTPPYSGGRPLDVLTQIVTDGDPPGLASLSPSLRDLCRKCLAQQADERFPTTAALAEAITLVNA
jgi:serine/threonine-protein kinase